MLDCSFGVTLTIISPHELDFNIMRRIQSWIMACRNRNCRNSACRNNACRNSACRNRNCLPGRTHSTGMIFPVRTRRVARTSSPGRKSLSKVVMQCFFAVQAVRPASAHPVRSDPCVRAGWMTKGPIKIRHASCCLLVINMSFLR